MSSLRSPHLIEPQVMHFFKDLHLYEINLAMGIENYEGQEVTFIEEFELNIHVGMRITFPLPI